MPPKEEETTMEESMIEEAEGITYEDQLKLMNAIATPVASKKLCKRIFKCSKKAAKDKTCLRRGVKDVIKYVKKGEKGFAVLAGDTFPIDVYCHLPCVFEDNDIPYVFVPSKHDLGAAIGSKRPTCVLLVKPGEDYMSDFGKAIKDIQKLPTAITL